MTGEMNTIQQDGTDSNGEQWTLHAELAKRLNGKLMPFDKYQGPYIELEDGMRLWLQTFEQVEGMQVYNETLNELSDPVGFADHDAIEVAARSVLVTRPQPQSPAHLVEAFVYKAALYCYRCGFVLRHSVTVKAPHLVPDDSTDETSYDSDDYPKGPYPNGGGEADTPQHCALCHLFLRNPLTADGLAYVRQILDADKILGVNAANALEEWTAFYDLD